MSDFPNILKSDIKYEIILPEYYKRDVKSNFITPAGEKGKKNFTIFMIPNLTGWFDERLAGIKSKMEEKGYKEIKFETETDYRKMTDSEITPQLNFEDLHLNFEDWWQENFTNGLNIDALTNLDIAKLYYSILK